MSKIICYCKNVTEAEIMDAINNGAKSLKDIQKETEACTGNQCKELNPSGKCCSFDIEKLLNISNTSKGCSCCCG
jgi:NAD(P)H-nitrite reductase large subunit